MGTISSPHSLTNADSLLYLADALKALLDDSQRAKIAADIKAHHALNDTEAKKAVDALAVIKEQSDALVLIQNIERNVAKMKADLSVERENFTAEKEAEWKKINASKAAATEALAKAQTLHNDAVELQGKANSKETALAAMKSEHDTNVEALNAVAKELDRKQREIEDFRNKVIELDKQTKAKVEALKAYNF